MKLIALAVLALMIPQESSEAETLFKKMEEKIAKAKTIYAGVATPGDAMKAGAVTAGGEFFAEGPNRFRLDIEIKRDKGWVQELVVCDGKQWATRGNEPASNRPAKDAPKEVGRLIRSAIARIGFVNSTAAELYESAGMAPDDVFAVSNFRLGKKEKIGNREGQEVIYRLKSKIMEDDAAVVWIDTVTHVPLRRSFKGKTVISEEWAFCKLDEKIDDAKFELPK